MTKALRVFLIFILTLTPLFGICQVDVPKWVDDIGGSTSNCISSDVGVDKQNNVYVTGFFDGTADFDPTSGVHNLSAIGTYDTFVAKYTTDGKLVWVVSFGGNATTQVNSLTVDKDGNPTVSGQFDNNSMTVGSTVLTTGGDYNAFVVKLNTNGTYMWAKSIGGGETDYGSKVIADSQDNVIETLRFSGTAQIGTQTFTSGAGGNFNALTVKFDPNGNLLWGININDINDSEALSADVDSKDNIIVGGYFDGNDNFNPLGTAHNLNGNGIFIAKYTSAGQLIWVTDFTGVASHSVGVCVDSQDNVFCNGHFNSTLQFTGTATTLNPVGGQDLFVIKYSSTGVFQTAKDIGGSGASMFNYGMHPDHTGNILIGGYFSGTVDFDPSPATQALVAYHGDQDFFLAKYDDDLNYKWAFSGGNAGCSQTLGRNVAIDYNNDVLYTGGFCSTVNFSGSSCSSNNVTAQSSSRDCFLAKYTQNTGTTTSEITGFTVPQQSTPAVIDQTKLIITVTVPAGTDITALVPTITYTSGVTLSPSSGQAENFTSGVTYTLTANCQTLNYTVNVVFIAPPTLLTTCSGNTSSLTGAATNPVPDSYLWQTLQGTTWVNAAGTNNTANYQTAVLTNTGNTNTEVDFRRQITTAGVSTFDSFYDITVQPALTNNLLIDPADSIFCTSGNPAAITGSTPTGGTGTYTYQWQSSTDGTTYVNVNSATAINYDPPSLSATTYYKRIVTSGTCATSASNIIKITITPPPSPPVTVTTTTCQGSSATITITGQTGITYNWYDAPVNGNLLYTGLSFTTPPLNVNTTYYIEALNGGCTAISRATAQVNITPLPAAPQVNSTTVNTCSGTQVTLNIVNPQNGYTYNWYISSTGGTSSGTGVSFTTPALSQSTAYYAEAVNSSGCPSATRTPVNITVAQAPDISAQSTSACPNTSAVLSAQSLDANTTINWYSSASGGASLHTGITFTTPDLNTTTTYYAEAVDNATQCVSTQRAVATVSILQQLVTPVVTVESTLPTQITFQWAAVAGASGYKVSTDNGETFNDPSSGTDGLFTTIAGLSTGQSVTIIVEAIGIYSCENSDKSTAVTAIAQYPQNDIIYVANAFTPNGDGKNDVVYVHGNGIQSMVFHIYDQFGELIFSSSSLTIGWNGTFKGTVQPVGVYVYYVTAQMYNGQKINKKGTITLLK